MTFYSILALVGALTLFLFGMELLGTGLRSLSHQRLRPVFMQFAQHSWQAMLTGAVVTAAVQSSSVVTSVLVGLVSGGVLTLDQAAGLIAGANIGTCSTPFLVCLGLSGSWLSLFSQAWALAILCLLCPLVLCRRCPGALRIGAGLLALLTGMARMCAALAPLANTSLFTQLMQETSPAFALLAGAVAAAVLQSSSACIAMLQAVSITGVLPLSCVVPILLGQNIGTCSTALLASIGGGRAARQTALLHLLFNTFGAVAVLIPLCILPLTPARFLLQLPVYSTGIAIFQLLFNLFSAALFFPFCRPILAQMQKSSPSPKRKTAIL